MKPIPIAFLLFVLASLDALADGIPFRSFRKCRVAVPATVLSLTKGADVLAD